MGFNSGFKGLKNTRTDTIPCLRSFKQATRRCRP